MRRSRRAIRLGCPCRAHSLRRARPLSWPRDAARTRSRGWISLSRRRSASGARTGRRRTYGNAGSRRCAERPSGSRCLRGGGSARRRCGWSRCGCWCLRCRGMRRCRSAGCARTSGNRRFRGCWHGADSGRCSRPRWGGWNSSGGNRGCGLCSGRRRRNGRSRTGCNFCCRLLRSGGLGKFLGFGRFFRCGQTAKMLSNALGVHQVNRAGVRLLFGDASFWEVLDQDFRLDLEFSSQFVNSDLIGICHSPRVLTATSYLGTAA